MQIELSYKHNRNSPLNMRACNPHLEFIGKVWMDQEHGALAFNTITHRYELVRRGVSPYVLPTGETVWHINRANSKRGVNTITHQGEPHAHEPYAPPVQAVPVADKPRKLPMRHYMISLPDDMAEGLRMLGSGNLSAGVRECYKLLISDKL